MSRKCAVCGKGPLSGNLVSHSNRKTKTTFKVNIQKKNVEIDGKQSKEYVCTKCLKTASSK